MKHSDETQHDQRELSKYWRSLEDVKKVQPKEPEPEFLSTPTRAGNENDELSDSSRREFIKLMGASLAMLGASACTRRPVEKIIPYLKKPEEATIGIASWYASTCPECDSGCGVLVKTREGRPIKLEGNPQHPVSKGGLCARGQASALNLYDPDRLRSPIQVLRKDSATDITWDQLDTKVVAKLKEVRARNGKVRILTGGVGGFSTQKLISDFLSAYGANSAHIVYEPLSAEETAIAGEKTYNTRVVPHYVFEKADLVLTFGADFLGTWNSPVEYAAGFAKSRNLNTKHNQMAQLVAIESMMSLTGTNADIRHRVRSGDEVKAALALAYELIVEMKQSKYAGDEALANVLSKYSTKKVATEIGIDASELKNLARNLWSHRGKGIVLGGGQSTKGDLGVSLDVVVNLLNSALENEGSTIDGSLNPQEEASSYFGLAKLISEMKQGSVDVLLIYKSNPLYTLPPSLGFEEALSKVGLILDFSTHFDETAHKVDYVCSSNHALETWGDSQSRKGLFEIHQPTIAPMYNTHGFEDTLIRWARGLGLTGAVTKSIDWHQFILDHWKEKVYAQNSIATPFIIFWEGVLRSGFFDGVQSKNRSRDKDFTARSLNKTSVVQNLQALKMPTSAQRCVLYPKISQYDGRVANNSWLQELPDPVTKITWDNYVSLSPEEAKKLNVKEGDVLRIKGAQASVEIPAHIQPGLADQTFALAVGYGRQAAGRVGNGIGVNVFPLSQAEENVLGFSALSVQVEKTGKSALLAATQTHHSLEGRPIVREATLKEFKSNPHGTKQEHESMTMWPLHKYEGYRWGMSVDLNACTGCSACVIGCQAENNIPVVGKRLVLQSKEMHWIRIDRYYSGNIENPQTVHQPMFCQHCENAPCETVCPVLATMHDHEGLNQQVYNRCVGTRYCSNNCPYKVRRFNWFTFTDVASPLNLAYNPDLTVRTRGIMEKCTFCVQRIAEGKDRAKDLGRPVLDGEIKTACQQSCPTNAIVFGDINNSETQVSKFFDGPRGYRVLEELNTRPSVTYLTKIRNV